jgi:hypothetical protein
MGYLQEPRQLLPELQGDSCYLYHVRQRITALIPYHSKYTLFVHFFFNHNRKKVEEKADSFLYITLDFAIQQTCNI